ncbi:unnamed protein product [Trifolium pratense]|uniref:Uncharacterized protein n=1 Tax=Trifolium pratense TaxID=57577 RepID=A0ACB0MFG9_TRIPR|nr:unnamed protein product [Trifolium pratense]
MYELRFQSINLYQRKVKNSYSILRLVFINLALGWSIPSIGGFLAAGFYMFESHELMHKRRKYVGISDSLKDFHQRNETNRLCKT